MVMQIGFQVFVLPSFNFIADLDANNQVMYKTKSYVAILLSIACLVNSKVTQTRNHAHEPQCCMSTTVTGLSPSKGGVDSSAPDA